MSSTLFARVFRISSAVALLLTGSAAAQCGGFASGFEPFGFESPIYDSVVFDDGSGPALYLAGETFRSNGSSIRGVARWDGTTLTQLGAGLDANIGALCIFDDGSGPKLVAGGAFHQGSLYEARAAMWNGQSWTLLAFVPHPQFTESTSIATLAVYDAGLGPRVFAGGYFGGDNNGQSVVQWNGSSWVNVGDGLFSEGLDPQSFVNVLRVLDLGSGPALFAGGRFSRSGNSSGVYISHNVASWTGGLWTSLGSGIGNAYEDSVRALEVVDTGAGKRLLAGGTLLPFTSSVFHLAQWNGSTWTTFTADPNGEVTCMRAFGAASGVAPGVWIGGNFSRAGNLPVDHVARWDGMAWSSVGGGNALVAARTITTFDDHSGHGPRVLAGAENGAIDWLENGAWSPVAGGAGADSQVTAAAVLDHAGAPGELFVSGDFLSTVGGVGVHQFARFDGTRWWNENPDGTIYVLRMRVLDIGDGPKLYATGQFTGSGGAHSNVARRDGNAWTLLPNVPTHQLSIPLDFAVFDDGLGPHLFVCGEYGLWRLDGTAWTTALLPFNDTVQEMLVHDDGSGPALFLCGSFQSIGGQPYRGIVRWNGHVLDALGGGSSGGRIQALCTFDDGNGPALFAGGSFSAIGGVSCTGVARWNGASWSALAGGSPDGVEDVYDMIAHDDGSGAGPELVVTGTFTSVGGSPASNIARWSGAQWRTMDGGITASALGLPAAGYALANYDDRSGRGPDLFVGGRFTRAGTGASQNIARWQSCGGDATTFCYGDGSATACPCGNASAVGDRAGCLSSLGVGGTLRTHGRASLGDDTLVLEGGSMPNSSVLYYQGASLSNGGAGVVFGDGVKCTAGPFVRLGTKLNVNGASMYPGAADPRLSVRGQITSPGTRHYQVRYRNSAPFCTPDTFNYTSGVSVAWSP